MNLQICVQHHPARAHLLPPLLVRIEGAVVVTDPAPSDVKSPLRTYLECLRSCPPEATHLLVIQDDAWPVPNFHERALTALAEKPDQMVAFFAPGTGGHRHAVLRASAQGRSWARLAPSWQPTVALCWLVEHIAPFLEHAEAKYDVRKTRGDDMPVGRWLNDHRIPVWATVPSLVEHPDVEPSLIRARAGKGGGNRARVAALAHQDLHTSD